MSSNAGAREARAVTEAAREQDWVLPSFGKSLFLGASSYREFGPLASHLRYAERASRKLARSTFYGMAMWRGETEQHGAFLGRLVDIGAELYAMCAAVVYAGTMAAEQPGHAMATQQLADVFCDQSRQRVERLFHSLWHNTDSATYALAQDVLGGRHTRLEEGVMDPSGEGPMVPPPEPGKSSGITPEAAAGANAL